jgi:hypothetical protein
MLPLAEINNFHAWRSVILHGLAENRRRLPDIREAAKLACQKPVSQPKNLIR